MELSKQQILTVKKILDRYQHHNVSISSDAYQEIAQILDLLTESLVAR